MAKIAINGFGRIGRLVFKIIFENHPDLEVVAINDLTDPKTLAHLLKYDSVYGKFKREVSFGENSLIVDGKEIKVFAKPNPPELPWKDLNVDIVLECTGRFTSFEGAKGHLTAGAKKVIISAPSDDPEKIPSFILGVNEENCDPQKWDICDMGSCTTNCLAPIAKILHENFEIIKGFMTTVHAFTNDQRILDLPHKDLRRARAASLNIIPTTTGAAKAIGRVIPELKGKLDGIAMRVPVPTVSVLDLICLVKKKTNKDEVNSILKEAAESERMKNILKFEQEPLVSSDFIGSSFSAIVDGQLTQVNENLIKVVAWYDNEWGYSCRLAEFTDFVAKRLKIQ